LGQIKTNKMQISSHRKGFPWLGVLGVVVGSAFFVLGVLNIPEGDPIRSWGNMFMGFCLMVSWIGNLRSQVIQIIVDDEAIRYHSRQGNDITISRSSVIDADISQARIRFRYKGPLDVQSATLPLRRFRPNDGEILRNIFTENQEAQQAGTSNGG